MPLLTADYQLQRTPGHIQKLAPENQLAEEENGAKHQL
jgi:hypothetical protein